MRIGAFLFVAVLGLGFGISCSSSPLGGDQGTGGGGDTGGGGTGGGSGGGGGTGGAGGCEYLHYLSPGCGVAPTCLNGAGGACYSLACGCSGKIIQGCGDEFAEPYAYTVPVSFDGGGSAGMTCNPNGNDGP